MSFYQQSRSLPKRFRLILASFLQRPDLPVDAYSVEGGGTIVFRSLCVLYEGMQFTDDVRAKDRKGRLAELSRRLGGQRDWGRFTSPEAILSRVQQVP